MPTDPACDCHIHVYDSRYPAAPGATLQPPPDAGIADYLALRARLGTSRVVIVTPSTYGSDNRPTLDALAAFGDAARGVAVIDPDLDEKEMQRLHAAGIRGVRLNLMHGAARVLARMEELCARVAPFGWHLQLFGPADLWPALAPRLRKLPVQLVFDHFGNVPADAGVRHPGFGVVSGLVRDGRAWVKLSGAMNVSHAGAPGYEDVAAMARGYLAADPRRAVWGTDWPHPAMPIKPDDVQAMHLLPQWCDGDEALLAGVLAGNPGQLYGFRDPPRKP